MLPDKEQCHYLMEMCRSGLLAPSNARHWALIYQGAGSPEWLRQLAIATDYETVSSCLAAYLYSEPWVAVDRGILNKFHVACLWLRFDLEQLPLTSMLQEVVDHLDAVDIEWSAGQARKYLDQINEHQVRSQQLELLEQYKAELGLASWLQQAQALYQTTTEHTT